MPKLYQTRILFVTIILLAAVFRLYGLKWDDDLPGYPHPDERF